PLSTELKGLDPDDDGPIASSSNFVFSADPVSDDEVEDEPAAEGSGTTGETSAAQVEGSAVISEGQGGGEGEGEAEVDEPEDDYNAAWEVLDVARTIYSKVVEEKPEGEGGEERLCLAECYLALGDVSLETGELGICTLGYGS
nr:hypothetical protein [Tanacetum cinerariifolium]